MAKVVKVVVVAICAFILALTFLPTEQSSAEIADGYHNTTSFASSSSYLLYMMQFQAVQDTDYVTEFAGSVGEKIATFATALCEELGNGGNLEYGDSAGRKVGKFRYNTALINDYSSSDKLRVKVMKLLSGSDDTCNISCCAFATFCWDVFLTGNSPFGTGCTTTIANNFQDIIEGDGTKEYVMKNARPGDLLFYAKAGGSTPPTAVIGRQTYVHAELYAGSYSGVDAAGKEYEIAYACVGSNQAALRRDVCIKPLSTTVMDTHPFVYLVSLSKWVASGNDPVDNADQVEFIDELLTN